MITDYLKEEADERYAEAVEIVRKAGYAATPLLQRKLRVGYVVSKLIMERLELEKVIGPKDGPRLRKTL